MRPNPPVRRQKHHQCILPQVVAHRSSKPFEASATEESIWHVRRDQRKLVVKVQLPSTTWKSPELLVVELCPKKNLKQNSTGHVGMLLRFGKLSSPWRPDRSGAQFSGSSLDCCQLQKTQHVARAGRVRPLVQRHR